MSREQKEVIDEPHIQSRIDNCLLLWWYGDQKMVIQNLINTQKFYSEQMGEFTFISDKYLLVITHGYISIDFVEYLLRLEGIGGSTQSMQGLQELDSTNWNRRKKVLVCDGVFKGLVGRTTQRQLQVFTDNKLIAVQSPTVAVMPMRGIHSEFGS